MIRDGPGMRGMMRAVGNRLGIGSLEMEREDLRVLGSQKDVFLDLGLQVAATSCEATTMVLWLLWLRKFVSRGPKSLEVEYTTF